MLQIRMLFQSQTTPKWLTQDQLKIQHGSIFEFYDHLLIKSHLLIL
jgi:hypothetical protein